MVHLGTGAISRRATLAEGVTCLAWAVATLYIGGQEGGVAALEEQGPARQVLALDSSLVQLATSEEVVVASTQTRAVVCHTQVRGYREVGTKARQGGQGVALLGRRLWAARPGCRLWEVEVEGGAVVSTRQYRGVLGEEARLHGWRGRKEGGGEHGFLRLQGQGSTLLTWSSSGRLYLLDVEQSGVLAWWSIHPARVATAVLEGDLVLVLDTEGGLHFFSFAPVPRCPGRLHSLTLAPLARLVARAGHLGLPGPWSELLLLNRSQVGGQERLGFMVGGQVKGLGREELGQVLATRHLMARLTDRERVAKVARLLDCVEALLARRVGGVVCNLRVRSCFIQIPLHYILSCLRVGGRGGGARGGQSVRRGGSMHQVTPYKMQEALANAFMEANNRTPFVCGMV